MERHKLVSLPHLLPVDPLHTGRVSGPWEQNLEIWVSTRMVSHSFKLLA